MNTARIDSVASRRLAELGQRWTPARRVIIAALNGAKHPRTVPELCALRPELKVSSVYRNLAVLEGAGIVHRIEAGEHARYELAEDLSQRHHHHLLCTRCGRVEDFEPGGTLEQRAVDGLSRAARKLGWEVTGHRLDVIGVGVLPAGLPGRRAAGSVMRMRTNLILPLAVLGLLAGRVGTGKGAADEVTLVAASWPVRALLEDLVGPSGSATAFEIVDLAPVGVEPHDLELTAEDRVTMERATAVVYVGGGFQPSLERAIDRERDIDLLSFVDDPQTAGEAGSIDPHVWLDPGRWAEITRGLGSELAERDGPAAVGASERAAGRLDALDADLREGLATCERREFFTEHAAFAYVADAYGLEQVALTGLSPEAEATAPRLQEVAERARADDATTVFAERGGEGRLARTLADEAGGLLVVELDPLEYAFDASETYDQRMRANLDALRAALDCT